jgi:hypothetical protein
MRPASFVLLLAVPVAACSEPDTRFEAAQVSWMEWPAEVPAATPFTVRLVGPRVYCVKVVEFVTAPSVDQSAVTFEPYFLLGQPTYCAPLRAMATASILPISASFDTLTAVPGLAAQVPRTYEIRAGTNVLAHGIPAAFPIRTFGDVTVRTAQVENGRINAGGLANAARDALGCVTLRPYGVYPGYVVENPPADTGQYWFAFVRGYIYEPAAPVCGASKVFHLVTRN